MALDVASDRHRYPAFDSATITWFDRTFGGPNSVQQRGWASIKTGKNTLISAPTGSGKTLAAFMAAIDELFRLRKSGQAADETRVVYVSPLKALANDVHRNLELPISGISSLLSARSSSPSCYVTTAVRTGDTSSYERTKMVKKPPNILVTTPEGLYALVTANGGRRMLATTRTVIVDEIHALAGDRRGSHLSLTLERLEHLAGRSLQRIGLSATQKPIAEVSKFLVGSSRFCEIVDEGHQRPVDVRIEVPPHPIQCVAAQAYWESLFPVLCDKIEQHRCTIVFVNSRRLCERVAHELARRFGKESVGAHHGSMSQELRRHAESQLKAGTVKALVATSSLELGIDVGDVDLVLQVGGIKRISLLLQRIGRSNHHAGGVPKAVVYPTTFDELVEAEAALVCVQAGELDALAIPNGPLDVLAQQIVASVASEDWNATELFALLRRAYPYSRLSRDDFDATTRVLSDGFRTEHGRRGQLVHVDETNDRLSGRKSARLTALCSGGTIPESGDYKVRVTDGVVVGSVAEDFAIHQMPGHVIQLGSNSWRVVQLKAGELLVESAGGESAYMPVWFGEQPPRSAEVSAAISKLREETVINGESKSVNDTHFPSSTAAALKAFNAQSLAELGSLPTLDRVIVERFRDKTDNYQVVFHSPHGIRIHRAWAVTIRDQLVRRHNVEIQATATDDGFLISLPGQIDSSSGSLAMLVASTDAKSIATAAVLGIPMFAIRWRHVASRSLLVPRMRAGGRVPPHIQRTNADELLLAAMPVAAPGQPTRVDGREGKPNSRTPRSLVSLDDFALKHTIQSHPLVRQTINDCLHDSMDIDGLVELLERIESGAVPVKFVESKTPSLAAYCVLSAKPPAYLDNGSMIDRRSRNVSAPRFRYVDSQSSVHPDSVAAIATELRPVMRTPDELADAIEMNGWLSEGEIGEANAWTEQLQKSKRITRWNVSADMELWISTKRSTQTITNLLRSRMEASPPRSTDQIAATVGISPDRVQESLEQLALEGELVAGPLVRGCDDVVWCDRRVLARLERLTRNQLRSEIEPIDRDGCFRFIASWSGLDADNDNPGRNGLCHVLESLDGVSLPAHIWDEVVLPARVSDYRPGMLNDLMLSGRFGWARLGDASGATGVSKLSRTTSITFFRQGHLPLWHVKRKKVQQLSSHAEAVLETLRDRGALFLDAIRDGVRLPPFRYEQALDELVAAGRITSDGFDGLRCLLAKPGKENRSRIERMEMSNVGRWSMLPESKVIEDPAERDDAIQMAARTLLARYGILAKELFSRESIAFRWVDMLRALRRMEARDEIRGGYFVQGLSGEQFMLHESFAKLRERPSDGRRAGKLTFS
ncbi:MAG: DEAD/DEAH box helicase, partial [Planctomycetota bacterium]